MNGHRRIAYASAVVTALNVLNLGVMFLLQMAIAGWFGAGAITDEFFLATVVPSVMSTALVGSLNVSLMPNYVEFKEHEGTEVAWRVVCTFIEWLAVAVVTAVILMLILAPQIVHVMAPRYGVAAQSLTVRLLRVSLPSVVFLALGGVLGSIHYAEGSFGIPGVAVASNNVLNLGMTALLYRTMGISVCAVGLTLGALLQLVIVAVPLVRRHGIHVLQSVRDERLKQVAVMVVPLVAGSLIYKSDVLVGRAMASLLPSGGISYLSYAQRIAAMVVTVSSAGLSTVIFPRMAKRAALKDSRGMSADITSTMAYVGLLTLAVLVPVCSAAPALVRLAMQRGAFGSVATAGTASAVVGYAGYVYTSSLAGVCSNGLYSLRRVSSVVSVGIIGFAANVILAYALVPYIGFLGVAVGASIAGLLNLVMFTWKLNLAGIRIDLGRLARFHMSAVPAAGISWVMVDALLQLLKASLVGTFFAAVIGAVAVVGLAAGFGNAEAKAVIAVVMPWKCER